MTAAVAVDNPYWDAVKDRIDPHGSLWGTPSIDGFGLYRTAPGGDLDVDAWAERSLKRRDFVARYSWTVPDPDTVAFVAEHSTGRLVDPMAGTGYWAHILGQVGVDVVSYDLEPGTNTWHKDHDLHTTVTQLAGADAVCRHPDRALFLSWPPYGSPVGLEIVRAYAGDRIIFIGEPEGGCTGDDDLYAEFTANWVGVAEHVPVQWDGIHDMAVVFDRKGTTI